MSVLFLTLNTVSGARSLCNLQACDRRRASSGETCSAKSGRVIQCSHLSKSVMLKFLQQHHLIPQQMSMSLCLCYIMRVQKKKKKSTKQKNNFLFSTLVGFVSTFPIGCFVQTVVNLLHPHSSSSNLTPVAHSLYSLSLPPTD